MSDNNQTINRNDSAITMKEDAKKCKHCQTDIPKKAKVCPICRRKQGGILKWIIIAIVVIIFLGCIAGGGSDDVKRVDSSIDSSNESSVSASSLESQNQDLIFRLGETAEYNNLQATLVNVYESTGSQFNTPSDGNIFVIAEFEIENNSDKEIAISSLLSFSAYQDGYATNLSLTALVEKTGEQLDGKIAPGKKMRGSIGYEIPTDYKELEINLNFDVWSGKNIVFLYEK